MGDTSIIQVKPVNGEKNRDQLISLVDNELSRFNVWFTSTFPGNQELSRYEKSILKTYLMHKLEENAVTTR